VCGESPALGRRRSARDPRDSPGEYRQPDAAAHPPPARKLSRPADRRFFTPPWHIGLYSPDCVRTDRIFPAATGTATFSLLLSGQNGFRFDILSDFTNPPPSLSGPNRVTTVSLKALFSGTAAGCAAVGAAELRLRGRA
jgi:hypothetical protein